jgi:hypothetical protein
MALSSDQITELKRFQKILNQLDKINSVSNNEDQKKRVSKEILKYKAKVLVISPSGIPDTIQSISKSDSRSDDSNSSKNKKNNQQSIFDNLVVMRLCQHSTDPEINLLSTLINLFETEYIPVLTDAHIKFDFSTLNERNSVIKLFENIKRTIKVLIETIEEYASTDKQEFKEQMGRMKNKQSRVFISEASEFFKSMKTFVDKTLHDISQGENIINNIEEVIRFNPKTESATLLQGKKIKYALEEISTFLETALANISIPK